MTQFRDGFMMKSPLPKHQQKFYDKARKLSEKSGTPGDYNRDDPKVNEQLDKAKEAEKSHESESAAKMSPFQGYVDGEERVSHYQPTADLYKDMIDTMTSSVDKIAAASGPENMAKRKAMKAQRLGKRIDKRKNNTPTAVSCLPTPCKYKNPFLPPSKPKLSRKPNSKRFIEAMRKKLFLDEKIQLYIN